MLRRPVVLVLALVAAASAPAFAQTTGGADLSIIQYGPVSAKAGDEVAFTLYIVDHLVPPGHTYAEPQSVTVVDTLPPTWEVVAAFTYEKYSSCTHTSRVVTCDLAHLPRGEAFVEIVARTSVAGEWTNHAVVSSATPDPRPENNVVSTTTTITSREADLSVTKDDAPDPVREGVEFAYFLNVTNAGPDESANVTLRDDLPEEVTLLGTSGATCAPPTSGNVVFCDLPPLAAGEIAMVRFDVRANAPGTLINLAYVSAATNASADPFADNSDVETTTVLPNPANDPPAPPEDVECLAGDGFVLVTWEASDGATTYRLLRAADDGEEEFRAATTDTSFNDTRVEADVVYRYRVTAVGPGGESAPSDACEATAIPFFPGFLVGATALIGSVAAYAMWRRRPRS